MASARYGLGMAFCVFAALVLFAGKTLRSPNFWIFVGALLVTLFFMASIQILVPAHEELVVLPVVLIIVLALAALYFLFG